MNPGQEFFVVVLQLVQARDLLTVFMIEPMIMLGEIDPELDSHKLDINLHFRVDQILVCLYNV